MNPELKRQLVSATLTFIAGFLIEFGTSLTSMVGEPVTSDILLAVASGAALVGVRAVLKYLNENYIIKPIVTPKK